MAALSWRNSSIVFLFDYALSLQLIAATLTATMCFRPDQSKVAIFATNPSGYLHKIVSRGSVFLLEGITSQANLLARR